MALDRAACILVHPTSLPGPFGIGDLGPELERFLDWAAEAGQKQWQVLPLSPTDGNGSPYNSPCAHGGNPLLISPQRLLEEGWLAREDAPAPVAAAAAIDFPGVVPWKQDLLRRSWRYFRRHAPAEAWRGFEAFVEAPEQKSWLQDWVLFGALKERHGGQAWTDWDEALKQRDPDALGAAATHLQDRLDFQRYLQFAFFHQWQRVREAARERGIEILGDLPFYVAHDSADVWAHRQLFRLDAAGRPKTLAGVPPDYFSETGQLWGNPTFDWDAMAREGYGWWIERLQWNLRLADIVRLDHFRGYVAHWEVPAGQPTAAHGRWVAGPGSALFEAARRGLESLPLVAEDLGSITDDVHELRRQLGLPGMRVLQFAFDQGQSDHLPERYDRNTVVYTGTHDNDTLCGWFGALDPSRRRDVLEYLRTTPDRVARRMIEVAYASVARLAVVPLQDVLELGSSARMNRPGQLAGNWRWRALPQALTPARASSLRELAASTSRL
jgi:4-alpha-glucanotransferase